MNHDHTDDELYAKLRVFNDAIRATGMGAYYGPSRGVSSLTTEQFFELQQAVFTYDNFTPENDPTGAHTQGEIELFGKQFYWQFEYEHPDDEDLNFEDPRLVRIISVMLADEKDFSASAGKCSGASAADPS